MADQAVQFAEYGSWVSPISSDLLVQKSITLKEVRIDSRDKGRIGVFLIFIQNAKMYFLLSLNKISFILFLIKLSVFAAIIKIF